MKLKSLLFVCCLGLLSAAFADNRHIHPQAKEKDVKSSVKNAMYPNYCEIEIINDSYDGVNVYGRFDDGSYLDAFSIRRYEAPHYISLYYYGYCHSWMNIYIDTFSGYHVYSGYTPVNSTIRIVPYLKNQLKAEVSSK
ncbi:hypothetical protein [Legionella spiritensis]|uniref:hypothetical protein n=1 Tax=Legionella spiritensis TaxID=452 RepID=UPI000F7010F6|nr:hypothetical protein [Legionella spiritensis]VEG92425.1 Uncharacterised protein [Legionella spiritensis]